MVEKGILNVIEKLTMEQCSICQYGKSVVDMYFYKDDGGMIQCAVVKGQDVENEQHVGIVGGVTEFKIDEHA